MRIFKLYYPDPTEGGGEAAKKPAPPKNYKPLSASQRRDWNDMLDSMQKDGLAGSKDLDQPDKNVGKSYIEKYRKEHPNTSITEDLVPSIQYEQQAFRTGESFPGLSKEQLGVLRKQVNPDYLKRQTADPGTPFNSVLSREYYPSFKKGDKSYGTDMDGYLKDFSTPPAKPETKEKSDTIPLPNYEDAKSRGKYAEDFYKKYPGIDHGRGDTPLRVNETPEGGSDTSKNLATKTAAKFGLDPALLYASSMEEGMSGLFPDKKGMVDKSKDKDYPVDGFHNFGLDNFSDKFPELVKKGYLSKDFANQFKKMETTNEQDKKVNSANFKTTDAALEAKAAYIKSNYDEVEEMAKTDKIDLSPKAKDFFALVNYNGGSGTAHKMLEYYKGKGLLKDDKFLDKKPEEGLKLAPAWENVKKRLVMQDALKKENLL